MGATRRFFFNGHWKRWALLALLPFGVLGIWAFLVLRHASATNHQLDHCSGWTRGIHRYQGALSAFHVRASALEGQADSAEGSQAAEALVPPIRIAREGLAPLTHGQPEPRLESVDLAATAYMATWLSLKRNLQASPDAAALDFARLDQRYEEVLKAVQDLDAFHRESLEGAIRDSRDSASRMILFSAAALLAALGFGIASVLALRARLQSEGQARLSRTLMDTIPDALLAWHRGGEIAWVNEGWWRLTGQHRHALPPEATIETLLPEGVALRLLEHEGEALAFNLVHADGRLLAVRATCLVASLDDGPLTLALIRDTSLETVAERKLKEQERLARLGRDLVVKARDLVQLLQPLLLALELVRRRNGRIEFSDTEWHQLDRGGDAAARLLADISGYALNEGLESQQDLFDLNVCVHEVAQAFLKEGRPLRSLNLDLSMSPALAIGSRAAFQEAVELLIQRGLDLNPKDVPVRVRTFIEDGWFRLEVEDAGHNISAEHLHAVFEPSFVAYTRPDQSPVGLFNVAQTLKDMGGSAEVSLTAEGLTRFRLSVPVECDL